MLGQHLILAKKRIFFTKNRYLAFYHPMINNFFKGFTKKQEQKKNYFMRRHMVQKLHALFVLIRTGFIYWSKLHTPLLSITTKLIILFIKRTIVSFSSASICTSDMRKNRGDKNRKTKIHLLHRNQNCNLMKTAPYPSLSLVGRGFFFARRYNLILLSMFTLI